MKIVCVENVENFTDGIEYITKIGCKFYSVNKFGNKKLIPLIDENMVNYYVKLKVWKIIEDDKPIDSNKKSIKKSTYNIVNL